ncbi:MAG TPA: hypothetical protein VN695_02765 [Streptosporangiaceae bacterium]|nr:hypothetical protein [Streptosporangiaceae bacterium]
MDSGFIVVGDNGTIRHSGLPASFLTGLAERSAAHLKLTDAYFVAGGGWVQFYDGGLWWASGIPQDAFTQIGAFISQGISVADFRLSPSGDWIVLGTGGHYAYSPTLDQPVIDSIADAVENRHLQPSKIVFSPVPNSWCLICADGSFTFHGDFQQDAAAKMNEMAASGYKISDIVFAPTGGWVILSPTGWYYSGMPAEPIQAIGELLAGGSAMPRLAFSGVPLTFTFVSYTCDTTRSEPHLGIGGDDTDTAELDVQVGGSLFTQRTPQSVNVGSNSAPQVINLSVGPILVPDPATRIVVALQIVNTTNQSLASQTLEQAAKTLIDNSESELFDDAVTALKAGLTAGAATFGLAILGLVAVVGLIAVTQDAYSLLDQDDDGMVGLGGMLGNTLAFAAALGGHTDDFTGPQPSPGTGRAPHYLLNWSVAATPVAPAQMTVSTSPYPVPMQTPTAVTVHAHDQVTSQAVAGQVFYNNADIGPTNSPLPAHTYQWVTKTKIIRVPTGGHPPYVDKTVTYNDYPSVLVSADGYADVSLKLGPTQSPPPEP